MAIKLALITIEKIRVHAYFVRDSKYDTVDEEYGRYCYDGNHGFDMKDFDSECFTFCYGSTPYCGIAPSPITNLKYCYKIRDISTCQKTSYVGVSISMYKIPCFDELTA